MKKILLILLIVLLVGGIGGYFIITFLKPSGVEFLPNPDVVIPDTNVPAVVDDGMETFENRGGWSVEYPSNWIIQSCDKCPDPTDRYVFVTFRAPSGSDPREGEVQVIPLANKPATKDASTWYSETKGVEQNLIFLEDTVNISGVTAYRIRYKDPMGFFESETIYVLSNDNRAYSISFAGQKKNTKIEDLVNFATYQKILESFKLVEPQK